MSDIYLKDNDKFYHYVKKYLKSNSIIHLSLNNKDFIDDSNLDVDLPFTQKEKIYSVHALNIKNLELRYSYIYDVVCNFLDQEFVEKDICGFKDNICLSVKNKSHCEESKYGCCYGRNRGLCKNLIDGRCSIKSISCKLFTCRYLRKNHIKYKVNDINLLRYFFNARQKFILDTAIFKDKDEIIKLLLDAR